MKRSVERHKEPKEDVRKDCRRLSIYGGAGKYVLHHSSSPKCLNHEVDYYIYVLQDPRDGSVRYVGRTNNLKRRYQAHLYKKYDGSFIHARREWIVELRTIGLRPQINVIETLHAPVVGSLVSEREARWTFHLWQQGAQLTNVHCIRMPHLYAAVRASQIDFLNEPLESSVWEELVPLYEADREEWESIDLAYWAELKKDPEYHGQTGRELERLWEKHLSKKPPNRLPERRG